MIRKASPEDAGAIAAFLTGHIETSMFLLGNLESHGIGNTGHPHGTTYFLRETGEGITGVFGAANGGFLMCQLPGLTAGEAQTYAHLLQGYTLRGMTGVVEQVDLILDALPLPRSDFPTFRADPLYALDLSRLEQGDAQIRPPQADDKPLLRHWMADYIVATGISAKPTREAVDSQISSLFEGGRGRLLIEDGAPTAMTGINAKAGSAVQVGGVFVPERHRGQGRAGRLVAAHLNELKAQGVTRAILFAASADAAKAYERIGFTRCGDYRVALTAQPTTLGSPR